MNITELAKFLADMNHNIDDAQKCLEDDEMFYIGMSKIAWMAVLEAIRDGKESRKNASLNALEENGFSRVAEIVSREAILYKAYYHVIKSIGGQAD